MHKRLDKCLAIHSCFSPESIIVMQVQGTVPTISVDKTDGCQMFLSSDCLGSINIITAKSSEMNVMIPSGEEFVEQPVPEQFRTTVTGLKLDTAPLAHEG